MVSPLCAGFLALACPVALIGCGGGGPAHDSTTTTTTTENVGKVVSVRVANALGSRGYGKLRVSLLTEGGPGSSVDGWEYGAKFQQVGWSPATAYHLSSKLVDIEPGNKTAMTIGGHNLQLKLPKDNAGSVGLLIADPCLRKTSWCQYADVYDMQGTLQRVLNALAKHGDLDYWMNVGDLFYEMHGETSKDFFSGLNDAALSTVHGISAGNHDFWIQGDPKRAIPGLDSFGNFHMQWYAQDAMSAAANTSTLFDLTKDPFKNHSAATSNFQWYHKVGNVAFVSYSSIEGWDKQADFFTEVCDWALEQNPALLVLLGHWHAQDMGCASGMDAPDAYWRLRGVPSCKKLGDRVKYFEGHRHCNGVVQNNLGFMIGSFGMIDGCEQQFPSTGDGAFGLPILDTRGKTHSKLYYIELAKHGQKTSHFDSTLECLEKSGLSGCLSLSNVQTWMSEPFPALQEILA